MVGFKDQVILLVAVSRSGRLTWLRGMVVVL
jgi:hypothetical protein